MQAKRLTETHVSAMWATLKKIHNVKLVRKDKSRLMRIVGRLIGRFGPMSRADFMGYWTTVGSTIYYPNGGLDEALSDQVELAAHEFTHVIQDIGYRYLLSPARLAKHETDAFIATMEMHHWLTGLVLSPGYLCRKLARYGVGDTELDYAKGKFSMACGMVSRGIYRSETVRAIIEILS